MLAEVEADADVARWLRFVAAPSRAVRWIVKGVTYQHDGDGVWYRREVQQRPEDMRRGGRAPDMVLGEDVMRASAAVRAAEASAASDMHEAYRGLPSVEVEQADGTMRTDYPEIPLKNADGSLTAYAKNMVELNRPVTRASESLAESIHGKQERVRMRTVEGKVCEVPARLAESIARTRGLKSMPLSARGKRRYERADGTKVRLVRKGGKVREVKV